MHIAPNFIKKCFHHGIKILFWVRNAMFCIHKSSILSLIFSLMCIYCKAESVIFEYKLTDFSQNSYLDGVSLLLENFERENCIKITPKKTGKIALKISTAYAPVMCVKENLLISLVKELVRRGFERKNILIIGHDGSALKKCTYLGYNPRKKNNFYHGMPVLSLDDNECTHCNWYYEHSLLSKTYIFKPTYDEFKTQFIEAKKSLLPTILMFEVDFWINLPVISGDKGHGVSGAMMNASIFNVTNEQRFVDNPNNCAQAIAEIATIPELQETYLFTIVSFEQLQYINSNTANANYISKSHDMILSKDMVAVDKYALKKINVLLKAHKRTTKNEYNQTFLYAEKLGLGDDNFLLKIVK